MAKKQGGGGFQSAAGLMRYFDEEEEKSPKLDHRGIIIAVFITIIVIELAKWQWPMI